MASGTQKGSANSGESTAAGGGATKIVLWAVIAGLVVLILFLAFKPTGGGIRNVDAAGVQAAIAQGAQVIDVRTGGEYQMGHIPESLNVPVDQIAESAQSWDRDKVYVIYCATGARSTTAVQTLQSMGFKNLEHFSAGIQAWSGELEKGAASTGVKIETAGLPVMVEFFTNS